MILTVNPRRRLFVLFLLLVQLCFARIHPVQLENYAVESRDLSITHIVSHEIVASGDALILIFSLFNHDPNVARDIEIQLDLPEGAHIASFTSERGEFFENEDVWKIKHLAGGNEISLQLSLLNISHVDLEFSASIKSAKPKFGPIRENNVTKGVIRVQEEDCLVVYNDFSQTADSFCYLYIDCVEEYPNNVLYIYDRWGNLVFEQERYDNTWNGKRHPRFTRYGWDELPMGTYYYVLNFPNADRGDKSGWIYLSD